MKNLVCLVALLFSVGCATVSFRPYVGDQQAWPTAEGSIVNVQYDLPIFTSLPSTPYLVLGELRIESPIYATPEERHLAGIVTKAQELGADALVFVDGAVYFSSNYGPPMAGKAAAGVTPTLSQVNRFSPQAFMPNISILAIKWTAGPPPGLPEKYAPVKATEMEEEPAAATPAPAPEPAKSSEPTKNFGPAKSGK